MNNIIIKGKHPVFCKTAAEEVILLQTGSMEERFYYICCRGIHSIEAQQVLTEGNPELIRLQNIAHPEMWHCSIRQLLRQHGFLPTKQTSDAQDKNDFKKWLYHNLIRSPKAFASEREYGAVSQLLLAGETKISEPLSETEELALLHSKNWDQIHAYGRKWHPNAEILFVQTAPVEFIFAYIRLFNLQSEAAECALIARRDSFLTWELALCCPLGYAASRMIKKSGNRYIWKQAVVRHYAFVHQYERKFGSIAKWQLQLEKSFDRKYFKKCL